jgi:hypothetical protein
MADVTLKPAASKRAASTTISRRRTLWFSRLSTTPPGSCAALRRGGRASNPLERLKSVLDVYRQIALDPPLPGGCPLLNTAIEADDTNPILRDRVRKALSSWRRRIVVAVDQTVEAGELEPLDSKAFASTAVAALEGGIMLSGVFRDQRHIKAVVEHLHQWLDQRSPGVRA